MKKSIFITAIVIVSLLFSYFLDVSEEKKSLNILVFTKTEGYRHENIKTGIEVLKNVAIKQRWMMTATENANYFNMFNCRFW